METDRNIAIPAVAITKKAWVSLFEYIGQLQMYMADQNDHPHMFKPETVDIYIRQLNEKKAELRTLMGIFPQLQMKGISTYLSFSQDPL